MTYLNTSGIDTSSDYDKLTRMQVNRLLDHHKIDHPPFVGKNDGIKLLEAYNINPRDGIEWEAIQVNNEQGQPVLKEIPKRTEPKRPANWDEMKANQLEEISSKQALEEKENEIGDLKNQLAELTALVAKMADKKEKPVKEADPMKMKFMAQRKWLKERGIELKKGDDAKALIQKALENEQESS